MTAASIGSTPHWGLNGPLLQRQRSCLRKIADCRCSLISAWFSNNRGEWPDACVGDRRGRLHRFGGLPSPRAGSQERRHQYRQAHLCGQPSFAGRARWRAGLRIRAGGHLRPCGRGACLRELRAGCNYSSRGRKSRRSFDYRSVGLHQHEHRWDI